MSTNWTWPFSCPYSSKVQQRSCVELLDEGRYLRAAQLCIEAGADTSLIPRWIDVGRQRARGIAAKHRADAPGR
jgi:hypothetical protein